MTDEPEGAVMAQLHRAASEGTEMKYFVPAKHTCWDDPAWDGCLAAPGECAGCDEATKYPCDWCGYGHVFTTHNVEAHVDDTDAPADPVILRLMEQTGLDCFDVFDTYFNTDGPYIEGVQPRIDEEGTE